jgi:hypothetical protein
MTKTHVATRSRGGPPVRPLMRPPGCTTDSTADSTAAALALASQAAEAQALFGRFAALREEALAALRRDDASGLLDALEKRECLTREIEPIVQSLVAERERLAGHPLTAHRSPLTNLVRSVEDAVRAALAAEAELMAHATEYRSRTVRELDELGQAQAVTDAYREPGRAEPHRLDLRR